MGFKRIPLTSAQYDTLRRLEGWNLEELSLDICDKIPGIQRKADIVGLMVSGCSTDPRVLNGIRAIVGMDVLAAETRPMTNEPEGNAYHYVFTITNDPRFPVVMYGPYRSQTRVRHWYEADDLDVYWTPADDPPSTDASSSTQ